MIWPNPSHAQSAASPPSAAGHPFEPEDMRATFAARERPVCPARLTIGSQVIACTLPAEGRHAAHRDTEHHGRLEAVGTVWATVTWRTGQAP